MRDIKFRGKEKTIGWVYGSLLCFGANEYAIHLRNAEGSLIVDPETIGQFTGLKDKNGVDIYENDIVKFQEFKNLSWDEESFKLFSIEERKGELLDHYISKVYWEDSNFLFDASENCQCCLSVCFGNQIHQNPIMVFEVIGNIHDNPELLK